MCDQLEWHIFTDDNCKHYNTYEYWGENAFDERDKLRALGQLIAMFAHVCKHRPRETRMQCLSKFALEMLAEIF